LPVRLRAVVELLEHPFAQLADHRRRVEPGDDEHEHPGEPLQRAEIGVQGEVGTRVLDLDRDRAPVGPHGAVHLAEARRRRGLVVEVAEPPRPPRAELLGEHPVHVARGHGGSGGLQPAQGVVVRLGDLGRDHRVEDAQCLADLHRAALELPEHGEQLLGVVRGHRRRHRLRVGAHQAPTDTQRRPTREGDRKREKSRGPGDPARGATVMICRHHVYYYE